MERWLPITGYEGLYEISDMGRVRIVRGELGVAFPSYESKTMALSVGKLGYVTIKLAKDRKYRTFSVHRLVLTTFNGKCPPGYECCHLDHNPTNNALSNLAWGTIKSNRQARELPCGEKHWNSTLTAEDVQNIRNRYSRPAYHKSNSLELAREFGVARVTILDVTSGASWQPQRRVTEELL